MKSNYEIAKEVIAGLWGNNPERITKLANAGYNPTDVQGIVNALIADRQTKKIEFDTERVLEIDFDTAKYNALKINFK